MNGPEYVYSEMGPEEQELDWKVTRKVLADATLMKTLQESQSGGEKHAVIAVVKEGELAEAYVSPEAAVRSRFPFPPVEQAFDYAAVNVGVCLVIVRDNRVAVSLNGIARG